MNLLKSFWKVRAYFGVGAATTSRFKLDLPNIYKKKYNDGSQNNKLLTLFMFFFCSLFYYFVFLTEAFLLKVHNSFFFYGKRNVFENNVAADAAGMWRRMTRVCVP